MVSRRSSITWRMLRLTKLISSSGLSSSICARRSLPSAAARETECGAGDTDRACVKIRIHVYSHVGLVGFPKMW
eukprot:9478636-Pyramimonas_sp.AAC.1